MGAVAGRWAGEQAMERAVAMTEFVGLDAAAASPEDRRMAHLGRIVGGSRCGARRSGKSGPPSVGDPRKRRCNAQESPTESMQGSSRPLPRRAG